ncbi:7f569d78-07e4-482b-ac81-f2a2fe554cc7 [Thermothielavioides terrestris]|jgi:hypothetical protein|uniref:lytic cellulose monooxygenase (C4-dehydrogenating) n=2 Tax=Thermothielavioides terrestris TaxID=2587410 RepID=G2R9S5_THETT|nr:glycoside hydrolase family 61 protein [Thermothielavioides terrestris NRRL 8126]AEO68763.1 glycoside hydrolase family 61 protein [Thermothielavioides terrestris NRRL 8126]SPQ22963.1 7f569d78-07e4-482b-ac81-f2a2fe554cc7 [Thermothielavioides terrestris]
MPPALPQLLTTVLTALTLGSTALAHSHLAYIIVNGKLYQGFDPRPHQANYPSRVGWSTGAVDDGFVTPANYSTPDIICHIAGTSPAGHAPVRPGDRIHVQWNGWPVGHIGPVLSYLARCESDTGCTGQNKTALRWTKIDDSSPTMQNVAGAGTQGEGTPGKRWATDVLIAANNSWQVAVPAGLPTGAYVLRNEIIALHYAARKNGAQNYPLCMNLWVDASGDNSSVAATTAAVTAGGLQMDAYDARGFYKENDPGVLVNVTAALSSYVVPGPTVAAGATPVPYAQQSPSVSTAAGTPVVVTRTSETAPYTGAMTPTVAARMKGRGYDRRG